MPESSARVGYLRDAEEAAKGVAEAEIAGTSAGFHGGEHAWVAIRAALVLCPPRA
jgi:hypothetical protein